MRERERFRAGLGLKSRFLIWLVFFILIIMGGVFFFVSVHEKAVLSNEIKLRGTALCNNLATSAEDFLVLNDDLALAKLVTDTKEKNEGVLFCFILDRDKRIWAHTDITNVDKQYSVPSGLEELKSRSILVQEWITPEKEECFTVSMPVMVRGSKIGEAHLAISKRAISVAVNHARRVLGFVTAGILAVGIFGILVLVSFIIGSLGSVTKDIEAIGNGDLDREITTKRRDEIGSIAQAVRVMTKKLKRAREEIIEKERMKKEIEVASDIQQALLPDSVPDIPGFEIETYYQAAMELGGDYYDIIPIDENRFGIVIADVSGKGVGGSLIMNMVRTIIKIEALRDPNPRTLLSIANFFLRDEIPKTMFVTLFYVLVDSSQNSITYSCAGHNPGFLFNPEVKVLVEIKPKGFPLGIHLFDEKQFAERIEEGRKSFKTGDVLFLYTDGITEAMNEQKELFGEERLKDILRKHGSLPAKRIRSILENELDAFTKKAPQSDDITFVILRRE
jgi:serine phosphatase RsbU (regulator of sigma subunit)